MRVCRGDGRLQGTPLGHRQGRLACMWGRRQAITLGHLMVADLRLALAIPRHQHTGARRLLEVLRQAGVGLRQGIQHSTGLRRSMLGDRHQAIMLCRRPTAIRRLMLDMRRGDRRASSRIEDRQAEEDAEKPCD